MKEDKSIINLVGYVALVSAFAAMPVMAAQNVESDIASEAEPSQWDTAGREMKEASHAVGEATKESWQDTRDASATARDTTKRESGKAWDKTMEVSNEAWQDTRDASATAWDATKRESGKAWDKTMEVSDDAWEKGKARLHEATAPDPEVPTSVESFSVTTEE